MKEVNYLFSNVKITLLLMVLIIFSCTEKENEACMKYANEVYIKLDTVLAKEASKARKETLAMFGVDSIIGEAYEAYHLLFYSSHNFGQSVKFEKEKSSFYLTIKCIKKEGWNDDCQNVRIEIEREDWEVLEKMIYEYDFWTVQKFKRTEGVLDGSVFFLDGNRPDAAFCNKKTFKTTVRSSPIYDKLGDLCRNILRYGDQLNFQYNQEEW